MIEISSCDPKVLPLVFLSWLLHSVLELWLGKTSKTKAASVLELVWIFVVGIFSLVVLYISVFKEKKDG